MRGTVGAHRSAPVLCPGERTWCSCRRTAAAHHAVPPPDLCRATQHNWFVLNDGTPQPTIVLGVSGCAGRCLPDVVPGHARYM